VEVDDIGVVIDVDTREQYEAVVTGELEAPGRGP
jgi:hypothetical protein